MVMFGLTIAQAKGVKSTILKPYIKEIAGLPEEIGRVLDAVNGDVKEIAKKYAKYEHAIYLGRDTAYPTAMEGALKLKEISYVDANAYAFGELKHGPIALIEKGSLVICLATQDDLIEKMVGNMEEVKARGADVVAVTQEKNRALMEKGANDVITIPDIASCLAPIVGVTPLQLFAYYMAVQKGCDVDKPRNLAKSVTVE